MSSTSRTTVVRPVGGRVANRQQDTGLEPRHSDSVPGRGGRDNNRPRRGATATRGRGTPGKTRRSNMSGNTDNEEKQNKEPSGQQSLSDRMQRRDGYTVVAPKDERRKEIAEKARREEERYKQYKEKNKVSHVSYVGTVGGGEITETGARQKSQQSVSQSNFNRRMKSQQHRDEKKRQEDTQLQKKKDEQRRKSESNKTRESERQEQLREDHRRKNAAFLDRREQENRQKKSAKVLSSSAAASLLAEPVAVSDSQQSSAQHQHEQLHGAEAAREDDVDADTDAETSLLEEGIQQLVTEFPHCDHDTLRDILIQTNGDMAVARMLLT